MALRKPRFIAGGPDEEDAAPDEAPSRTRYPCAANGCPMPGAIFPASGSRGMCGYHYATNSSDWPRITQALTDWRCVSAEVNEARRVLTDQDLCTDVKAQNDAFRTAWERLQPAMAMGGWNDALKPAPRESYSGWCRRLEEFMGARVLEVLRQRVGQGT